MNALILGATGLIGSEILKRIVDDPRYEKIYVVGRSEPKIQHAKIHFEKLELSELANSKSLLDADHVYCALGSTIKAAGSEENFRKVDLDAPLLAARAALSGSHLKKFLVVTALGADEKSKVFYNRTKGELERSLCSLDIPELYIFRPSLLIGERAQKRRGERVASALMQPLTFVFKGPLKKYKPIDSRIVAHSMIQAALAPTDRGQHVLESDVIEQSAHQFASS